MESYYAINTSQSLYHHGVKGMRWGRRRYQNEDGSLTPAGREHYARQITNNTKVNSKETKNAAKAIAGAVYGAELAIGAKTLAQVTAMSVAHIAAMSNPVTAIGMNAVAMATGLGLGYAARYGIARAGQKAYMKAARNQAINKLAKDNVKNDISKNYKDEKARLKKNEKVLLKTDKNNSRMPKADKYLRRHGYSPSSIPGHDPKYEYTKKNSGIKDNYAYIGGSSDPVKQAKHEVKYNNQLNKQAKADNHYKKSNNNSYTKQDLQNIPALASVQRIADQTGGRVEIKRDNQGRIISAKVVH